VAVVRLRPELGWGATPIIAREMRLGGRALLLW